MAQINRIQNKPVICPRCKLNYMGFWAVSRRDNKTLICPGCAKQEALFDGSIMNVQDGVREAMFYNESAWLYQRRKK